MASFLIPPNLTLTNTKLTPGQLIADRAFDEFLLITNESDFLKQFHSAWKDGKTSFTYVHTNLSSDTRAHSHITELYTYLTNSTYGYTVGNVTKIMDKQYSILVTIPQ